MAKPLDGFQAQLDPGDYVFVGHSVSPSWYLNFLSSMLTSFLCSSFQCFGKMMMSLYPVHLVTSEKRECLLPDITKEVLVFSLIIQNESCVNLEINHCGQGHQK